MVIVVIGIVAQKNIITSVIDVQAEDGYTLCKILFEHSIKYNCFNLQSGFSTEDEMI